MFSLALILVAVGCRPGGPAATEANRDVAGRELGDGPAGIYVLRSVAGTPLPAVVVSHESYRAVMTSDTMFLHADGTGGIASVKRVTEDEPAGERTMREQASFTYALSGDRLTAEIPCGPLMSCLMPPHYAGALSADALELDLALNYRVPLRYAKVAGPSDVADVRITPTGDVSVAPGATLQLTVAAVDAEGRTIAGRTASWSSFLPSVATVSATGAVRGVAPGAAVISAFIDGRADSVVVTVRPADTVVLPR
jgi:hypothetical protein